LAHEGAVLKGANDNSMQELPTMRARAAAYALAACRPAVRVGVRANPPRRVAASNRQSRHQGDPMNPPTRARRPLPRRLVLAAAGLAGLLATLALCPDRPPAPLVRGWDGALVAAAAAQSTAPAPPAAEAPKEAAPPAATPKGDAPDDAAGSAAKPRGERSIDAEITIDGRGVVVRKGGRSSGEKNVVVGDHEFDSFESFVEQAPWLAGLVFMVTALVFLVPLLVIILVVWYKMRRTRMMNDTMLKLAERGVVPPAQAMDAIAAGRVGEALRDVPPTAPLYEQAKVLRKRAAWSDLRKGVLIGGVGLGLAIWGVLDDGTPNGFGLILLFVGIGYTILWYFEDRRFRDGSERPPSAPGGV
jgi:hypothetical protein